MPLSGQGSELIEYTDGQTVGMLVDAKERYIKGEDTSQEVVALLRELAHFYPITYQKGG
jgi:hypothetical protein